MSAGGSGGPIHSDPAALPIAMFDSGVGGLTVLHECLVSLPEESFLYLGDSANFPYGTKEVGELRRLVVENTEFLLERGAKLPDHRLQLGHRRRR